jgi:hypothetical protein
MNLEKSKRTIWNGGSTLFFYNLLSFLLHNMLCNGATLASLICRLLYHEADSKIFSLLVVQLFLSISDF